MLSKKHWELFWISFLILFLELLLIRLIGTEIRIFSYLSNIILITIFVGTGLGMLIKRPINIYLSAISIFIVEAVLATQYIVRLPNLEFKLFSGITELLAPLSNSYIWLQAETYSKTGIAIGLFLTILVLSFISFLFIPLGQYLGNIFNKGKNPIVLYSINVVASLLGMWSFQAFSVLGLSPYFGLFICQIILLILAKSYQSRLICLVALFAAIVLMLPKEAHQPYEKPVTFWSPYQKLTLSIIKSTEPYQAKGWYLEVNNVGYMGLLDLSQNDLTKRMADIKASFANETENLLYANQYSLPYKIKPGTSDVLIIGGGAGNDAAAAIQSNVKNIDLVEIDPTVVGIGKKYHPEKPYSSPNVHVYVDDGRAYIERTTKKYDIIIMSLADSHTTSSSLTNVQLDNYLYTTEALTKARERLNENGALFLTFEVTRPWIGQRVQSTLQKVFNNKPQVVEIRSDSIFGWGGVMFIATKNGENITKSVTDEKLLAFLDKNARDYSNNQINLLTDNWPYIYLDKQRIPLLHIIVAIIALSSLFLFKTKFTLSNKLNFPFFFLGSGFMLFEVQNIAKSALIFGNTWVTNLFIISGVLVFILAANLAAIKKIFTEKQAFLLLFLIFIIQVFTPINIFNNMPLLSKVVSAIPFLTLPHFFSGVIFASLFAKEKERSALFGSNLIGSAVGGFLAISSYMFGISSLLYMTILLYGLGFLLSLKKYHLK